MKKISPVTIATSLLAVLLAINAILLATRKPSAPAGGTGEAPAQGVVPIGGSPNQAPGHFRLTDISYHDWEKGFALDADCTGQNIVFPEG